jgi:hypothetical protein
MGRLTAWQTCAGMNKFGVNTTIYPAGFLYY